jgi:hypothetical protein
MEEKEERDDRITGVTCVARVSIMYVGSLCVVKVVQYQVDDAHTIPDFNTLFQS